MSRYTLLHFILFINVTFSSSLPYDPGRRQLSPNAPSIVEPVLARDFPDPSFIAVDGVWYAFATSGNGHHVQAAVSDSFEWPDWQLQGSIPDLLPDAGDWAMPGPNIWAPYVIQLENGNFVLYYAAPSAINASMHCVGAATAATVLGPYEPLTEPLACPLTSGGAIDAAGFLDPVSGSRFVVYKIDGNSLDQPAAPCGAPGLDGYHPTPIMVQEVDFDDGVTLIGDPFEVLDRGVDDGPLVEAPNLFYDGASGLYFLTYSSNCYSTPSYDIKYAYSTKLNSIFTKSNTPLMTGQTSSINAPGGLCTTPDGSAGLFHGTVSNGSEPFTRYLYAMLIRFEGNELQVAQLL